MLFRSVIGQADLTVLPPPAVVDSMIIYSNYDSSTMYGDIALLHLATSIQGISPIPLWVGDQRSLAEALNQQGNLVSQGGYPQDSLDTLLVHSRCQVRKLSEQGILEHRCDTLPGDSGSPLLLPTRHGWRVVAIQSSAPEPGDRWRADNLALAIPTISSLLNHWMS